MKIVYIISTLKRSGLVNVIFNIINNLDREQFEPIIITLSPEFKNSIQTDFEKIGVNIYSLNLSRAQGYLFGGFKLRKIIDKIKPDIIHSHCFRSNLFSALFLGKYKKIATIHSYYKKDYLLTHGRFAGWLMIFLSKLCLKKIKNNVCVSEFLADILNSHDNIKFSYINNGVDETYFKPAKNKSDVRKKLNLPLGKKVFIFAGNLIKVKNPLFLANAIKNINNNNLYFIFCGIGSQKEECEKLLENTSNVLFTDFVDNLNEYFQASDYYIAVSLSEGFHLAAIEAMSCGLPVILSEITAHKYFLSKDKNAGLTFDVNNINDLTNKIYEILNMDYSLMSDSARKIVANNFSAKSMSEKYQKFYLNTVQ